MLAPQDGPGSLAGLLGNYNGWTGDDFQLPDGTLLDPQSATADFSDVFADAWRVTAATSLLDPILEPGSLTLLGVALAGLGIIRRRSISFAACRKPILRNGFRSGSRRDAVLAAAHRKSLSVQF
jgi:hypothetical protein